MDKFREFKTLAQKGEWKNYDFILIILTIIFLLSLGIICIYGTIYSSFTIKKNPNWANSLLYQNYLKGMNFLAAPFALGLVVFLGLCIPKRLLPRQLLLKATGITLSITVVISFSFGLISGISFILLIGTIIQIILIFLLILGKSLHFEKKGFLPPLGSSLLHLGYVIIIGDLALFQNSTLHIPLFWLATFLIGIGMLLSFYGKELEKFFS